MGENEIYLDEDGYSTVKSFTLEIAGETVHLLVENIPYYGNNMFSELDEYWQQRQQGVYERVDDLVSRVRSIFTNHPRVLKDNKYLKIDFVTEKLIAND